MLPTPFAQTRYYHRSLNPKKLIDIQFSSLPKNQKISTREKIYQLPDKPEIPEGLELVPTEEKHIKQIYKMLMEYLKKFKVYTEYTRKECLHWFVNRPDIIESYVIVDKSSKVHDFFCFYNLPSSILNNPKYKNLKAAYSYYFIANSVSLKELYKIALIKAK